MKPQPQSEGTGLAADPEGHGGAGGPLKLGVSSGCDPWGFWTTWAMVLMVLLISLAAQEVGVAVLQRVTERSGRAGLVGAEGWPGIGLYWTVVTLVSGPVEVALVLLLVWLRRGCSVREYLAWHRVSGREWAGWIGVALVLAAAVDVVTWLVGRPVVPDVLMEAYGSTGSKLLFWLAVVGMAPVSEELLFRGFLFRGLAQSCWGAAGAIIGSALVWGGLHGQYDTYGVATVVAVGLVFGVARWRSGSVGVPWAMHMLFNTVALTQAALMSRV